MSVFTGSVHSLIEGFILRCARNCLDLFKRMCYTIIKYFTEVYNIKYGVSNEARNSKLENENGFVRIFKEIDGDKAVF